jgi:CBS domain-containing protein
VKAGVYMPEHKTIGKWMKTNVVSIQQDATLLEAAKLLVAKRVGTLPVVDQDGTLVGLTTMRGLVKGFLPDFVSLMENVEFVKDFGALEEISEEDIAKANTMSLAEFMEEPVSVEENCSLVRALAIMSNHQVVDIPVVRDGKLVGIASRVDIGRAFLESWLSNTKN